MGLRQKSRFRTAVQFPPATVDTEGETSSIAFQELTRKDPSEVGGGSSHNDIRTGNLHNN